MKTRKIFERSAALLLAVVLLFGMLPTTASAATTKTVTVVDENGDPVTNATVTAKRSNSSTSYTATHQGSGKYTFSVNNSRQSYNITVTADGYESATATMSRNNNSVTVTLQSTAPKYTVTVNVLDMETGSAINGASVTLGSSTDETSSGSCSFSVINGTYDLTVTADGYEEATSSVTVADADTSATVYLTLAKEYISFEIFYIATGELPDSYTGAGDAVNYGPSANDTPLVLLEVDINALKSAKYSDVVLYKEDNGNHWHFTPVGEHSDMDALAAFWEAVLECATAESIAAFEETGLLDSYMVYCLKAQGDGTDYHGDGILTVTPPVYVIELYKEHTYVGGSVTDQSVPFKTMAEVLASLEHYLGQNITWNEDENGNPIPENNIYYGTYIVDHTLYTIEVEQMDLDVAQDVEGSEIPYEKRSDQYYLAQFDIYEYGTPLHIEHAVTYKDGLDSTLFYDHEYGVGDGETVPAFTGNHHRHGYTFQGWTIEGGDGTVYTDAQVQAMTVTSELVFVASYTPNPYTVTYELNGGTGGPDALQETYLFGDGVTVSSGLPTRPGYSFLGWDTGAGEPAQSGAVLTEAIEENYTLTAQWSSITVTFYSNYPDQTDESVFRTYYTNGFGADSDYHLSENGAVADQPGDELYDIPALDYETGNKYIFKGWYTADGTPMDWYTAYTDNAEFYAHWLTVDQVSQDAEDGKQNIPGGTYSGFDLVGNQIRYGLIQSDPFYDYSSGQTGAGGGLRFITALSTAVWDGLQSLDSRNAASMEYGFVLAKTNTARNNNETSDENYELKYVGSNVNGEDTRDEYWYARNIKCSGLALDHFNGQDYRLYTAVVTYKAYQDETQLEAAYAVEFLARAYIRYYDANGLLRTCYNNYTGNSNVYHGCSTSYTFVKAATQAVTGE